MKLSLDEADDIMGHRQNSHARADSPNSVIKGSLPKIAQVVQGVVNCFLLLGVQRGRKTRGATCIDRGRPCVIAHGPLQASIRKAEPETLSESLGRHRVLLPHIRRARFSNGIQRDDNRALGINAGNVEYISR